MCKKYFSHMQQVQNVQFSSDVYFNLTEIFVAWDATNLSFLVDCIQYYLFRSSHCHHV